MGLMDDVNKAIPEDLKERAREAGGSAKAAATDVGELASTAADAVADAFDRGEQSFRDARSEGQGLPAAVKEAAKGALDATDDREAGRDDSDPRD